MANEKRLIDVCAEMRKIDECLAERKEQTDSLTYRIFESVKTALEKAPTVDAVEVVHGEWVFGELGAVGASVKCSNCGYGVKNADPILWITYQGHKFCGACGAKMDGDGNG